MRYPELTASDWRDVRKRAVARAYQLTKSVPKAEELADAAIAAALEPDRAPWDPARHPTFAAYRRSPLLCPRSARRSDRSPLPQTLPRHARPPARRPDRAPSRVAPGPR